MTLILVAYTWLICLQKQEGKREKEAQELWWKKTAKGENGWSRISTTDPSKCSRNQAFTGSAVV
jgi:hypothetical protein